MNKLIISYASYRQAKRSMRRTSSQVEQVQQGSILSQVCQLILSLMLIRFHFFFQWIGDRYQYWKEWLYDKLGLKQLDQWLIKELIFPEHSALGVWINTFIGVILINVVLDQIKPFVWGLLVEIIKAATPHLGATAFTLLNHTAQVWKAVRSGLEK